MTTTSDSAAAPTQGFSRRVLVVEDQPLIRSSLVGALKADGFEVCEALDARSASAQFRLLDPDGVLIDIDLGPGPSGLDLLDGLRARSPRLPAVILTRLSDPRLAGRDLKTDSVTAFINKQRLSDPSRVVIALNAAIAGEAGEAYRDDIEGGRPALALTDAQISVLELVADGMTNEQIAEERGISTRAVQMTLARALAALGVEPGHDQNPRVLATRAYMAAIGLLPHPRRAGVTDTE